MPEHAVVDPRVAYQALQECRRGRPRLFMENFLWIKHFDDQRLVPFHFNHNQNIFYDRTFGTLTEYSQGFYVLVLKDRKATSTTFWMGAKFAFMVCRPGFDALEVADSEKTAKLVLGMLDVFYDNLPEYFIYPDNEYGLPPWPKPEKSLWDTEHREIIHGPIGANGRVDRKVVSSVTIASARNQDFGRSTTPKMGVLTEAGAYDPTMDQNMRTALEDAFNPNAWLIEESTPKGTKSVFHANFKAIKEGRLKAIYIFLRWFDNPENYLPDGHFHAPDGTEGKFGLTQEEKDVTAQFPEWVLWEPVTKEELATGFRDVWQLIRWRQWKVNQKKAKYPGDAIKAMEAFLQEHAEDDVRCWTNLLTSPINAEVGRDLIGGTEEPKKDVTLLGGMRLRVWEYPDPKKKYAAGTDVSRGLPGSDPMALEIIDASTGLNVVELWGLSPQDEAIAEMCKELEKYGNPLWAIEITGNGFHAVEVAQKLGYPNLYERDVELGADPFKAPSKSVSHPAGWDTNLRTRPAMMADGIEDINTGQLWTRNVDMATDLVNFDAKASKHTSDRVMALFMANQMARIVGKGTHARADQAKEEDLRVVVPSGGGRYNDYIG